MNIVGYVEKYGHMSFNAKTFNDVDSLLLAELSYLDFDGLVPEYNGHGEPKAITEFNNEKDIKTLTEHTLLPKKNKKLLNAIFESARFSKLKIAEFKNIIDYEKTVQFCAVVFFLDADTAYIAFRGTDPTMLGWNEDFNMAFMETVPAQQESVEYLNTVITQKVNGIKNIIVGGHSKGGNLAFYSSIYCEKEAQDRITSVYNHDGPGFNTNVFETEQYKRIENKLYKTVPFETIVGLVLNNTKKHKIVKCHSSGILQHDPFNWRIKDGEFLTSTYISAGSSALSAALADWINQVEPDEREQIIQSIFEMINKGGVDNINQFKTNGAIKMFSLLVAYRKLSMQQKEKLKSLSEFNSFWRRSLVEKVKSRTVNRLTKNVKNNDDDNDDND